MKWPTATTATAVRGIHATAADDATATDDDAATTNDDSPTGIWATVRKWIWYVTGRGRE